MPLIACYSVVTAKKKPKKLNIGDGCIEPSHQWCSCCCCFRAREFQALYDKNTHQTSVMHTIQGVNTCG